MHRPGDCQYKDFCIGVKLIRRPIRQRPMHCTRARKRPPKLSARFLRYLGFSSALAVRERFLRPQIHGRPLTQLQLWLLYVGGGGCHSCHVSGPCFPIRRIVSFGFILRVASTAFGQIICTVSHHAQRVSGEDLTVLSAAHPLR